MKNFFSISWIIVSAFFIIVGIYACFHPEELMTLLAYVLGVMLFVAGIGGFMYYKDAKGLPGGTWLLFDGIVSVVFALLIFFNATLTQNIIPIFVAFLLVLRGIGGVIYAIDMKRFGLKYWYYVLVVSILSIILGFIFSVDSEFAGTIISIVFGVTFIMSGILSFMMWVSFKKISL